MWVVSYQWSIVYERLCFLHSMLLMMLYYVCVCTVFNEYTELCKHCGLSALESVTDIKCCQYEKFRGNNIMLLLLSKV